MERQSRAPVAVKLSCMHAPDNNRINYWIRVAKRMKKFIIAAL
ncbi:MAG: hypothetical protein ABI144_08380 [Gallionella sp.]